MYTPGRWLREGDEKAHQALSSLTISGEANVPFRFMGHTQRLDPNSSHLHHATAPQKGPY